MFALIGRSTCAIWAVLPLEANPLPTYVLYPEGISLVYSLGGEL